MQQVLEEIVRSLKETAIQVNKLAIIAGELNERIIALEKFKEEWTREERGSKERHADKR